MEIANVFSIDIPSPQDFTANEYTRNSVFALFSCGTKRIFAMTDVVVLPLAVTDVVVLPFETAINHHHCKERSDEAIHENKNSHIDTAQYKNK
jgi:hypothetical protein